MLIQSITRKHLFCYGQRGLVALALCMPLALSAAQPAQAGWGDILRGETSGAASGRSRGGGIRDTRCLSNGNAGATGNVQNNAQGDVQSDAQIAALVSGTSQRTTQANPSFFLYVPFDRHGDAMELEFKLATRTENSLQPVIDSIRLPLPNKPGLVSFQLPADISLESGKVYDWSFKLKCSANQPVDSESVTDGETFSTTEPATADSGPLESGDLNIQFGVSSTPAEDTVERDSKVLQEVFGTIERVSTPSQLATALTTSDPTDDYQAYVDGNLWFDLVPAVARRSADWSDFLEDEFNDVNVDDGDLVPEVLREAS